MNATIEKWLTMPTAELDDIYRSALPGKIPDGDTLGTAILAGSRFAHAVAKLARWLAWQGKVFSLYPPENKNGTLVNKVTPFRLRCIVARVYIDKSWMDDKDTIVIDYSKTSFLARLIRDEIREVEHGVWLGKVWLCKWRVLDFALLDNNQGK